jgi:hypothetical protein
MPSGSQAAGNTTGDIQRIRAPAININQVLSAQASRQPPTGMLGKFGWATGFRWPLLATAFYRLVRLGRGVSWWVSKKGWPRGALLASRFSILNSQRRKPQAPSRIAPHAPTKGRACSALANYARAFLSLSRFFSAASSRCRRSWRPG